MQPHFTTLYVVLDIGKNVDWLGAYAGFELQPVIQPLEVRSDRPGFERVTAIIDGLLSCVQILGIDILVWYQCIRSQSCRWILYFSGNCLSLTSILT